MAIFLSSLHTLVGKQAAQFHHGTRVVFTEAPELLAVGVHTPANAAHPFAHVEVTQRQHLLTQRAAVFRRHLARCHAPWGQMDKPHQGRHQPVRGNGFGHVVVHACGPALLGVLRHGQCRHGHNGQRGKAGTARCVSQRSDAPRSLQAVHHRHLNVHQHHVVFMALHLLHSLSAVDGLVHLHALAAQQLHCELAVDVVVFHEQHTGPGQLSTCAEVRRMLKATFTFAKNAPPPQYGQHRVKQGRWRHRLDENAIHASLL